jgi:hypothetical protein
MTGVSSVYNDYSLSGTPGFIACRNTATDCYYDSQCKRETNDVIGIFNLNQLIPTSQQKCGRYMEMC